MSDSHHSRPTSASNAWPETLLQRYRDEPLVIRDVIKKMVQHASRLVKRDGGLSLSNAHEAIAAGGGHSFHTIAVAFKDNEHPKPVLAPYLVLLVGRAGATLTEAELSAMAGFVQRVSQRSGIAYPEMLDILAPVWAASSWEGVRQRVSATSEI